MEFKQYFREVIEKLKSLDNQQKKGLFYTSLSLFLTLFSYPIIRSTADAFFLDCFGAKKSPHVWICSVVALAIVVSFYNKYQSKLKIHRLYLLTSVFSFGFFLLCLSMITQGHRIWAFPLFVWKEVYIVLLIHMAFGFLNTTVDVQTAKILYGPVGAVNALAGTLGGLFTSKLTYHLQIEMILIVGGIAILVSSLTFWQTNHRKDLDSERKIQEVEKIKESPFRSIIGVRKYVLFIILIVALSQFCINLANFQFNILFDQLIPDRLMKTRYFGTIYSSINGLSLIVQLLFVPVAFKLFQTRSIHIFIPFLYFFVSVFGFFLGGQYLLPVAASFVIFKGIDYSLFNTAREILYFPLENGQKYGAKYLADMVAYRFAKGVISIVLIFLQTSLAISILLIGFLIIWFIILIYLFKERTRILGVKNE